MNTHVAHALCVDVPGALNLERPLHDMKRAARLAIMFKAILPALLLLVLSVKANAQEIVETNFQHIDTSLGNQFLADSVPNGLFSFPLDGEWVELMSSDGAILSSRDRGGGYLAPAVLGGTGLGGQLVLQFDEPVCVIGFRLKTEYPARTERSHFSFAFFDLEGAFIEELDRWPARGTTNQAYASRNTNDGFQKVVINNHDGEAFALREVRARSCAIPTS